MNLLGARCVRCCFVSLEYELECVCRARPPRVRQSEDCGSAMITDGPRLPKQAERINTVARAALSRSAPTWATPSSHFTPNSHPVIGEDVCMDRIMYTPWTLGFCGHPHVLVSVSFLQFGETLTRIEWFLAADLWRCARVAFGKNNHIWKGCLPVIPGKPHLLHCLISKCST